MYCSLFNYLDHHDLFNLRLLSKKFNYIVSQYRIDELILFNPAEVMNRRSPYSLQSQHSDFVRYKSIWFASDRPKNFMRLVDESKTFLLKNPSSSPLFILKFLKRLKLDRFKTNRFKTNRFKTNRSVRLKDVNQFERLEQLEIMLDEESNNDTLTLPLLRVLQVSLRDHYGNRFSVSIEAPKLVAVCFGSSKREQSSGDDNTSPSCFQFRDPSSVTYLKTGRYHPSILAFSGLQQLEIDKVSWYSIDRQVLSGFVALKEVIVLKEHKPFVRQTFTGARLERFVPHPTAECTFIYYRDWEIEYDPEKWSYPPSLLSTVQRVVAAKAIAKSPNPSDQLLELLGHCQCLSDLEVRRLSCLNQNFFNTLPSVCSLNWLLINDDKEYGLDYGFIARMFFLRFFETNQELSTEVICKLAAPVCLETVRFSFDKKSISLKRSKAGRFLVANYLELGLSDFSKRVKPERLAKLLKKASEPTRKSLNETV